jgi:ferrous iron transport protein B
MTTCCADAVEVKAPAGNRRFAVIGNPNSGKTTLFNSLTGLKQKVGNYPGVTGSWEQSGFPQPAK